MKKALIIIAIVLAAGMFILFVMSTLMPQKMADFFMSFGASEYNVQYENGRETVKLHKLGDGVTNEDRLQLMKKMLAIQIFTADNPEYEYIRNEFNQALITASEDDTLTASEFEHLSSMHRDIIPEKMINNWIQLAKDYQESKHNEGNEQQ